MSFNVLQYPDIYYDYEPKFEVWVVHFKNTKYLTIKRLSHIFGKYGTLKSIYDTGKGEGHCFINYWRKDSAEKCVLNVHIDNGIQLLPFNSRLRDLQNRSEKAKALVDLKREQQQKSEECESYYEGRSVMFINAKKLKKDKIERIFSKFGIIDSIQQTGHRSGYCFVRYIQEESARQCALDMMSRSVIKLEKFKPYSVLQNEKEQKKIKKNSSSTSTTGSLLETTPDQSYSHSQSDCVDTDEYQSIIHIVPQYGEKNRETVIELLKYYNHDVPRMLQRVTLRSSSKSLNKSFHVPFKSRIPWKMLESVVVNDVPAEPVIVANIPEICGPDFIMEYFDLFQPLYTSLVEVTIGSLHYCYVYFDNSSTVKEVEMATDNTEIMDKNVVVVSPDRLWNL